MRIGVVAIATLLATTSLTACVPQSQNNTPSTNGGSTSNSGGTTSNSGGSTSKTGGSTSNTGGTTSNTGGTTTRTGGTTTNTGGGTSNTGGLTSNTGGVTSNTGGGTSNTGGVTSNTGGNRTGGNSTNTGGTTVSSNCTDTQPPGSTDCATWKSWNNCDQAWFLEGKYCEKTCGKCGGGSVTTGGTTSNTGGNRTGGNTSNTGGNTSNTGGNTSSTGGTTSGDPVTGPKSPNPAMSGGSQGFATRYWDCCKPSCSWTTSVPACGQDGMTRLSDSRNAKSGCEGGPAYECYDFSPWYDAGTNMSYGFVAHNGVACGTCYMFQFTGEGNSGPNAGATALRGQQMIVQTINIGGLGGNQFDLLIPGGGVGDFARGCQTQWGGTGAQTVYGGMLADCKGDCSCMKGKCSSFFGKWPALKAGCDWFTNWFSCADNPKLMYKQVSCPSQITQKSGVSG